MRPSIGLTAGGGGGKARTCASDGLLSVAIAARPAAPAAAALKNSRRLVRSCSGRVAGLGSLDQQWPQQFVKLQRGMRKGVMEGLLSIWTVRNVGSRSA